MPPRRVEIIWLSYYSDRSSTFHHDTEWRFDAIGARVLPGASTDELRRAVISLSSMSSSSEGESIQEEPVEILRKVLQRAPSAWNPPFAERVNI